MDAAADYARAIEYISKAHLTPYVAYMHHFSLNGIHAASSSGRIVVRVSDGKVISGSTVTYTNDDGKHDINPVSHPIFDAACYRATRESTSSFDGAPALKLDLVPICNERHNGDHDYSFTTLYVDPQTLRPLDANGDVPPDADSRNVAVSLDERFAQFGGRVMPSAIRVDVTGSGWMFWLQVHVRDEFSDYQFLNSPNA